MITNILITGLRAPSGKPYVSVSRNDNSVCLPLSRFSTDEKGVKLALNAAGITIIGSVDWKKFLDRVSGLNPNEFDSAQVIESVGWNGPCFALPDGTYFAPKSDDPIYLAIEVQRGKCGRRGKLKAWRREVADPLSGHGLASFLLMASFMPPLLNLSDRVGNVGFELVGPKAKGKSTLQYAISSVLGGPAPDVDGHYWVTLDTTLNALEDMMKAHADLPLIMDEANLLAADATKSQRANIFKALAFKLGSGSVKGRLGWPVESDYRLGYIISTNEPLASLVGQSTESARAAADRLITLPIDEARPFGVFDKLPKAFGSSSEFARGLLRSARANHGHAIRKFLAGLVAERRDERRLRKRIRRYVTEFESEAGVDRNDGTAVRVAEAFGLVFAAGELAVRYGALPREFKTGFGALEAYRLHLGLAQVYQSFEERLLAMLLDPRVAGEGAGGALSGKPLAYLRERSGKIELIVPTKNIERLFSDWDQIRSSREVGQFLKCDGRHQAIKRKMPSGRKERTYCFSVPQIS